MRTKKIFCFIRMVLIGTVAMLFITGILVRNTRYSMSDPAGRAIDPDSKKILFHIFGIKNMTLGEKIILLDRMKDLPEYCGKVDAKLANTIFPDQSRDYAVNPEFVINFHLMHGNPIVQIGSYDFTSYFYPSEGVYLCPLTPDTICKSGARASRIYINSYFAEMAHSKQFYEEPFNFGFRKCAWEIRTTLMSIFFQSDPKKVEGTQYHLEGTIEHEAHSAIQPQMEKEYADYRCMCFKNRIDCVEEKIVSLEEKMKKKKGTASKKLRLESLELQAKRDSMVNGPLFYH